MQVNLTSEQLRWLKLLVQHLSRDGDPPNIPQEVLAALTERKLVHLRHGEDLKISFDGIRAIREDDHNI